MSDRPDGTRSPGFGCRSLLSGPSRLLLLAIVGLFSPLLCHAFILLSHSASARQYEVGQTYTYDYFTTVILDEPIRLGVSPSKNVGYQLTGYVTVQAVWQNPERTSERLLQINLDTPQLFVRSRKAPTPDGFIFHASQLSSLSMHPLYVLWSQGKITNVYYVQADTPSLVNIKKGIASLFQYQLTARTIEEVDASGRCQATYLGDATSERVIVKKKRECQVPKNLNFFSHPVKALSADVITDNEIFYSFSREESIIEEVKAQEKHSLHVHSWKVAAGRVVSDQHLKLTGSSTNSEAVDAQDENSAIKALNRRLGHKLVLDNLTAEEEVKYCSENCLTLAQMVDDFRDSLRKNMTGTIRSSSVYLRLLVKAREAAPEMLAKVLKSPQNKDILPVLIDVMAAAQTFQAHQAAMDVLNFRSESKIDLTERYLWALSVTSHPPEEILADMLKHAKAEIPSEKLHETVILTLASLTDRFCAKKGNCQKKIVENVQKFLYKQLDGCDDADCKVLFLRAISNVQLVKNVQVFTRFMDSGERKTAVAAAKGLHNLPLNFIKETDLQFLEEVYLQLRKKRDSTVRTIAADILLRKDPSVERLSFLLSTLGDQESHELKTFIVERIRDLIHLDEGLKQKLRTLLGDKKYGNYHVWGQRGRSTAFTRYLYEDGSKGSNGSFVAAMELGGGMLKRIKFDVNLGEEDSVSTLLSLGVFAGGLNSFSSSNQEEVDPEEAEESATAGIELSLLGSQLRPFVFFNGQGELMGHLWSGTASSRTPALQGIYLLHDHSQKIALSNGIMAQLSLLGGISLDLGGQVEISLWYKTAHSLIDNKAAFVIRGSATADTSFVQSQLEFNLAADSQLQLVTDSDFSDKTIMCIQMSQPEFHLKHKVRKWEHIIGQKHRLHKSLKRTHVVPGRTFVMNQKNSELCNIMFKDKS